MTSGKPLLILKTGQKIESLDAIPGDYEDWIATGMGWEGAEVGVIDTAAGGPYPEPAAVARVDYNPRGVEVGTVGVRLAAAAALDPLFSVLPAGFPAQLSHRQSVLKLPPGATLLGSSAMEPHQGFAFGPCAWGVQFHPEFDERIINCFVRYYREILAEQGRSAEDLLTAIRPAPESQALLKRFGELVREGR
ncbi:MAG: GMP synthase [Thioalkalivibrio sp.]|nr:GMP synthase [Thioalkalivibrio sp.]